LALICVNGRFENEEAPLLFVSNRAFKYGDGVFETMLVREGVLQNADLHFERLFRSLQLLEIDLAVMKNSLLVNIHDLCQHNNYSLAKVRLTVYRDKQDAGYVMESEEINSELQQLNEKGWSVCIHPFVRKSCDAYANIKSVNFLPYVMAERYREEKSMDECLVLNAFGNIADGSRTNIFLIKNNEVITPALHQGCIDGVMRRWMIESLKKNGRIVKQAEVSVEMLEEADAVFLTNAVRGIKWVERFGDITFRKQPVEDIGNLLSCI
jgi:branched-chain amino acid aminotransferase